MIIEISNTVIKVLGIFGIAVTIVLAGIGVMALWLSRKGFKL